MDAQQKLMQADSLLSAGEFKEAQKLYKAVLKETPDDAGANFGLAEALSLDPQGDATKAMEFYEKAVKADAENPFFHESFANFLIGLGRFNDAEREYRAAAQCDVENSAEYLLEMASGYIRVAPLAYEKMWSPETEKMVKRKALGYALEALGISLDDAKKML